MVSRVLVTGANGFVGSALMDELGRRGIRARGAIRAEQQSSRFSDSVNTGALTAKQDWTKALENIDVVIHLAGKVPEREAKLSTYIEPNITATANLARQAKIAKVKRFIFISSIKVNGEKTEKGRPFTEIVCKEPADPYALSKFKAENELMDISRETKMELVIIRPPLIYGPGVKGSFAVMLKWLKSGVPLPFDNINNRRSMIAVDNLVDFICLCISHPDAANEIFLISDDESVSTTTLLKRVASVLSIQSCFIFIPSQLLRIAAILLGKKQIADSLLTSLELDISKAKKVLGWKPCVSMGEQLSRMLVSKIK